MTKAEAYIHRSHFWNAHLHETRYEDHQSTANTLVNIYLSMDNEWRLCCYSYYGDSILWKRRHLPAADIWRKEDEWIYIHNIEFEYDTYLPMLERGEIPTPQRYR